jgi:hypothetical protein
MYPTNNSYYNQMQPQTQYYQNQMQSPSSMIRPQMMATVKGRPVSSIEEARAATIDFDGSIFYFPDLANKKIYTKQINMDGTATLNMYELKEMPVEPPLNSSAYVTREEFEIAMTQLKSFLSQPSTASTTPMSEPQPQKAEQEKSKEPLNLNF